MPTQLRGDWLKPAEPQDQWTPATDRRELERRNVKFLELLQLEVNKMTDIIQTKDKLACAERELKMRKNLYPRWVKEDKMSAGRAAHEIACMEAIVDDYRALAEKERLL